MKQPCKCYYYEVGGQVYKTDCTYTAYTEYVSCSSYTEYTDINEDPFDPFDAEGIPIESG